MLSPGFLIGWKKLASRGKRPFIKVTDGVEGSLDLLKPGDIMLVDDSEAPLIDHNIYNMLHNHQETARVQALRTNFRTCD